MREHEKWFQQLLNDTKESNLRVIRKSEKSEDNTDGIKKLYKETMMENFPNIGKK